MNAAGLSPDGHTLAGGTYDGTVQLLDIADPAHPRALDSILTDDMAAVDSVAFSPDGHTLASGSADGTIQLWAITDPAHLRRSGSPWQVNWEIQALDQTAGFLRDDPSGVAALWDTVSQLADEPRPPESFPNGSPDLWRLRAGRYRVFYAIDEERRVVQIDHVARLP